MSLACAVCLNSIKTVRYMVCKLYKEGSGKSKRQRSSLVDRPFFGKECYMLVGRGGRAMTHQEPIPFFIIRCMVHIATVAGLWHLTTTSAFCSHRSFLFIFAWAVLRIWSMSDRIQIRIQLNRKKNQLFRWASFCRHSFYQNVLFL